MLKSHSHWRILPLGSRWLGHKHTPITGALSVLIYEGWGVGWGGGGLHFPREKGWGSLRVVATPLVKSKSAWVQVTVGCPPRLELVMVGQDRVKSL